MPFLLIYHETKCHNPVKKKPSCEVQIFMWKISLGMSELSAFQNLFAKYVRGTYTHDTIECSQVS